MAVIFSALRELWITDGSLHYTRLLSDIVPGDWGSTPASFTPFKNNLMFAARGPDFEHLLCVTDGTAVGTRVLQNLNLATPNAQPVLIGQVGERFLFEDDAGIWAIDDPASSPELLLNANLERSVGNSFQMLSDGRLLFEIASPQQGSDLWITGGDVSSTVPFAPWQLRESDPFVSSAAVVADTIYFGATKLSDRPGYVTSQGELWMSDGTTGGTNMVVSLSTLGAVGGPYDITAYGSKVCFTTFEQSGNSASLWISDGTAAGTFRLSTFVQEPGSQTAPPRPLAVVGGKLLFNATDAAHGLGLWATDGTVAGTAFLSSAPAESHMAGSRFAVVGDRLVYTSHDQLWVSDGTVDGTRSMAGLDTRLASLGQLSEFTAVGDRVYFSAQGEPWTTDGTAAGTRLLRDISTNGWSSPSGFTYLNLAPEAVDLTENWANELQTNGTVVGRLVVESLDRGDTYTYTLLDDGGGRFAIKGDEIVVADGSLLDYEQGKSHLVRVRVTDQAGLSLEKVLVIFVGDAEVEDGEGDERAQTFVGGAGDDGFNGMGGDDRLFGGGGADLLDGGEGADRLAGNAGNDTYVVDSALDAVREDDPSTLGGTDRVYASVDCSLSANVEQLTLTGIGAIDGSGNNAANTIGGNAAANMLRGFAGNDVIHGMAGTDEIYGHAGADALSGGVGNDVLSAGEGNDALNGGTGHDRLDGGLGLDTLAGGSGNDIYIVDNVHDVIVESRAASGIDRVFASVDWQLESNVEHLVLQGGADTDATGNALANSIRGNAGANVIDGGLGCDVLAGGAGKDTFAFSSTLHGSANRDFIADFSASADTIALENTGLGVFNMLVKGTLAASAFHAGEGATQGQDSDDRIIYNTTTGALFYDSDGSGDAGAIQFAILKGKPVLTANDFVVV